MAGRLLLDTSVVIDLFAGDDAVQRGLAEAEEIFVPSVAIGELLYGARISARAEANVAHVEAFSAAVVVLACDLETAYHYSEIKAVLRTKGRPLPENDVWIAALAKQHDLALATRDGHFREIEGLSLTAW
jgi:tRNA(fMet)-specific endonuclease VapC